MKNWTAATAMMFLATLPLGVLGESKSPPAPTSNSRESATEKQSQKRNELWAYVDSTKRESERAFQSMSATTEERPAQVSVVIELDEKGRVAHFKIVESNGTAQQEQTIQEFIRSQKFGSLPHHLRNIQLFWKFICGQGSNDIEFADSPEADSYNKEHLGGAISRTGVRITGIDEPHTNSADDPYLSGQDVDFGPYMASVQSKIKRAWFPPKGNEFKHVGVRFAIGSNGELLHLRIDRSSGLAIADQAAVKAVENAAPFKVLPPGAKGPLPIQFVFAKNPSGGGGHGASPPSNSASHE